MRYRIDIAWHNISGISDGTSSLGDSEVNGSLSEKLNDIDNFDFAVYYGSPNFGHFAPNLTYVDLYDVKRQDYIFHGRVISVDELMGTDGVVCKRIHCESELAFLCDSVCDVQDVLVNMRNYYNAQIAPVQTVDDATVYAHKFVYAMLTLFAYTTNRDRRTIYPPDSSWNSGGYFNIGTTGYQPTNITQSIDIDTGSTFSVLKALRDKMGYDIWTEHEANSGHIILKYGWAGAREQGTTADSIELSENMMSLDVEKAPVGDGRVTRVIPLGGVGANGLRLTIASVNQGERWLSNNLESTYGVIEKSVIYDELVDDGNMSTAEVTAIKTELMRRGNDALGLLTNGITGISCRAADLYELDETGTHPFIVGALFPFICSFFGLDGQAGSQFRLTEKTTDLAKPYDPELTFELPTASYRSQAANERIRVQQQLYALERSQAKRLDNTSIKKTTTSAYDPTAYNQNTIYLVDNGDDTGEIILNGTSYGGGGSTTTVGNAAVMSTDFSDFNVTEQLMLDITPNTTLYYGASPSFMVIQGHYCLLCSTSNIVQYSNGVWTIGQTAGLYERIIANKAKFGSQIGNASGGGWLSGYDTTVLYPSRYIYETLEIYQISTTTAGNTYTAYFRLYWANTTAPSGDWWESTMSWGSFTRAQYSISLKAANNTNYMTTLNDVFIVPVLSQFTNDSTIGTLKTPYGYANIAGYLIFSSEDGTHYGVVWYPVTSGDTAIARAPCVSEAEQCFALGISQRTEPVVGGGT